MLFSTGFKVVGAGWDKAFWYFSLKQTLCPSLWIKWWLSGTYPAVNQIYSVWV